MLGVDCEIGAERVPGPTPRRHRAPNERCFLCAIRADASESELHRGIPIFMEQLIETLNRDPGVAGEFNDSEIAMTATGYGRRLFGLGFTVSELVHGYGSVCAVVTKLAGEVGHDIATSDFEVFNRVLDVAIAESVTAHEREQSAHAVEKENERIGMLAHELRNALYAATVSLVVIKKGTVGTRGPTADVLDRSLTLMGELIDRSLAEVRLRTDPTPVPERFRLADALDQIIAHRCGAKSRVVTWSSSSRSTANWRSKPIDSSSCRPYPISCRTLSNTPARAAKCPCGGAARTAASSSRWKTSVAACLPARSTSCSFRSSEELRSARESDLGSRSPFALSRPSTAKSAHTTCRAKAASSSLNCRLCSCSLRFDRADVRDDRVTSRAGDQAEQSGAFL